MSNYKAYVAAVSDLIPIKGADKIQIAVVLGEYTIVSKDVKVDDVGVFFPAGTQLSPEFCQYNNLYRNKELNRDKEKSGFFDENRKVRCQKFMGVKSEGFFADLSSLAFVGENAQLDLNLGDSFEELNGWKICNKFLSEASFKALREKSGQPKKPRIKAAPFFREHVDTEQFKYEKHKIRKGDLISIQAKGHGTSGRSGVQLVKKQVLAPWKAYINSLLKRQIFKPKTVEQYEHVVGTRRTMLAAPEAEGFHGSEAFRFEAAEQIRPFLSEGMTAYYEIVGYVNGKPIMGVHNMAALKDKKYQSKYGDTIVYSYNNNEAQYSLYIYRVTYTTHSGEVIDMTQPQLVAWCKDRGLEPSLDVIEPFIFDGNMEALESLVERLTERPEVLTEDYRDPRHISEGVIVRADRGTTTPLFLKSKSFAFRVLEGIIQEQEADLEDIS